MEIGETRTIEENRESSMVSSWTEYLCLERLSEKTFQLSVKGFMVLGELKDYYDEETEDYVIPEKIDGFYVEGREDEYIVGGPLINHSDDVMPIQFEDIEDDDVKEWLRDASHDYETAISKIKEEINNNRN